MSTIPAMVVSEGTDARSPLELPDLLSAMVPHLGQADALALRACSRALAHLVSRRMRALALRAEDDDAAREALPAIASLAGGANVVEDLTVRHIAGHVHFASRLLAEVGFPLLRRLDVSMGVGGGVTGVLRVPAAPEYRHLRSITLDASVLPRIVGAALDVASLERLPSLSTLKLYGVAGGAGLVEALARLPRLTALSVEAVETAAGWEDLRPEPFTALAALSQLRSLRYDVKRERAANRGPDFVPVFADDDNAIEAAVREGVRCLDAEAARRALPWRPKLCHFARSDFDWKLCVEPGNYSSELYDAHRFCVNLL